MRVLFWIVFLSGLTYAQAEVCSVTTFFVDNETKTSSSRFLVGKFILKTDDNEPIFSELRHHDSDVTIRVGVEEVKGIFEKEPKRLRIALSFEGKKEDVFDVLERAEAETIYDKRWKWLSVSKGVQVKNRIYTFTFGCEREGKRS